jgi:hypothetical protein
VRRRGSSDRSTCAVRVLIQVSVIQTPSTAGVSMSKSKQNLTCHQSCANSVLDPPCNCVQDIFAPTPVTPKKDRLSDCRIALRGTWFVLEIFLEELFDLLIRTTKISSRKTNDLEAFE